jgi:putative chitinase
MITTDTLRRIMPRLSPERCAQCLPHLERAMEEFLINTPLREAAFLAQIAHESGQFRFMEEIWGPTEAQRRYEPQSELAQRLGNTGVGDGKRFKGRGPIQITGRANYQRYGELLGLDIVSDPPKAASPEVGFRIAGLYWQKNGLNELADQEMFKTITKRINGGFNGLEDRRQFYDVAKGVLGISATRGIDVEDTGDDSAIPRFSRGLDFAGEAPTPAVEKPAAKSRKTGIDKSSEARKSSRVKKVVRANKKKAVAVAAHHSGKSGAAKRVEGDANKVRRSNKARSGMKTRKANA